MATEVFSAIQGEAALVGERQVFVRLTGCNIRCAYCDQPEALDRRPGPCRIERTPGRRDWRIVDSPLPIPSLVGAVDRLCELLPHHSVSLTGGEPLMQSPSGAPSWSRRLADGRARRDARDQRDAGPGARARAAVARLREHGREAAERRRRAGRPDVQRRFLDAAIEPGSRPG